MKAGAGVPEESPRQPAALGELPKLASLTKAAPSPLLRWQLLDVLYAYCLIMRLYNGDPMADPQVGLHGPTDLYCKSKLTDVNAHFGRGDLARVGIALSVAIYTARA